MMLQGAEELKDQRSNLNRLSLTRIELLIVGNTVCVDDVLQVLNKCRFSVFDTAQVMH